MHIAKKPSITDIISLIQNHETHLSESDIYNIYLFGSRLHKCNSDTSDYDLMCIVGNKYFDGSKLFETSTMNINIYHLDFFLHLLDQNIVWVIMCCEMPKECIWKETVNFKEYFKLNLPRLKKSALQDAAHNWSKAKRLWRKKSYKISMKNVVHAFRYLMFALQIAK